MMRLLTLRYNSRPHLSQQEKVAMATKGPLDGTLPLTRHRISLRMALSATCLYFPAWRITQTQSGSFLETRPPTPQNSLKHF